MEPDDILAPDPDSGSETMDATKSKILKLLNDRHLATIHQQYFQGSDPGVGGAGLSGICLGLCYSYVRRNMNNPVGKGPTKIVDDEGKATSEARFNQAAQSLFSRFKREPTLPELLKRDGIDGQTALRIVKQRSRLRDDADDYLAPLLRRDNCTSTMLTDGKEEVFTLCDRLSEVGHGLAMDMEGKLELGPNIIVVSNREGRAHAIAINVIDQNSGRLRLFDPNYGELEFQTSDKFWAGFGLLWLIYAKTFDLWRAFHYSKAAPSESVTSESASSG